MKLSRMTAAIMMASLSTPLLAASEQTVGKLTSASQGTYVARNGKMIPAYSGQALYVGDRVLTRDNGKAEVAMSGCSYSLGATSTLSVGTGACTATAKAVAGEEEVAGGAASGGSSTGIIVAVAAAAAVGAGVYVAVDKDDTKPASP